MSGCSMHIEVSSDSRVVVFAGNLLKAPPLNRRGRKKWHERYFLLRANKTIEIHKSRKASEALKSPRRVIDLRECISLEVGLEYKNLQHILSLGTFKRTFFLAAPSDPLMLQWGNVLEKVKNAEEGETIEVLDIGLRNSRNYNAVHRVRPSPSSQRIASTPASPQKSQGKLYHKGVSKSSYAISSYGRDSSNGIGTRSSGNIGYTSYYSSPNHRASLHSHKETPGREQTLAGLQGKLMQAYHHKLPQQSAMEAVESSHQRKSSVSSSNTSSSGASPSHIVPFSSKVPPPNIMARGLRESSNESSPKHSSREGSSTRGEGKGEEVAGEERWKKASSREFVVREGLLHRSRAFRGQSPKLSGSKDGGSGGRRRRREYLTTDVRGSEGRVPSEADSDIGPLPSTTIKQSRHYRKIDLRPEKPLFDTKDNDPGSSDEESDSTVSEGTGKSNPGIVPVSPPASKQFRTVLTDPIHFPSPIPSRFGKNGRRRNFSGPPISGGKSASSHSPFGLRERLERGRIGGGGGGGGGGWGVGGVGGIGGWGWERNSDQFETEVGRSRFYRPLSSTRPPVPVNMPHRVHSLENLGGHFSTARTNNYCQVAILEKDEGALSGITSHKAGIASRKLSDILSKPSQPPFSHSPDYDFQLPTPNASSPFEEDTNEEGGGGVGWDYPYAHHLDHDIQLSPPRSPLFDDYNENFELPARGTDSFLYNSSSSLQSPIDNIIAPPVIFDVHSPLGGLRNETISEEGEVASDSEHTENDPQNTVAMGDRNSTESNDTGYTSGHGASPGCQDRKNLSTVEEFGAAESENLAAASSDSNAKSTAVPASPQDVLADLSISSVRNSQSGNSIHHSQTSLTSTDSVRCYIPLVFQRKGRGGRGSRKGVSIYIAVCLVENSDQIIKELLSQKAAAGYLVVECEGEVGRSVVSVGDDFTVETALEDLEFGFSITTSTQKDVYINTAKVREFHFQIDNLFGCLGKPFSCDVEIRHADQITVLPIEIESAT